VRNVAFDIRLSSRPHRVEDCGFYLHDRLSAMLSDRSRSACCCLSYRLFAVLSHFAFCTLWNISCLLGDLRCQPINRLHSRTHTVSS
jgi:hypothetical protein